jgi:hypothetical protein
LDPIDCHPNPSNTESTFWDPKQICPQQPSSYERNHQTKDLSQIWIINSFFHQRDRQTVLMRHTVGASANTCLQYITGAAAITFFVKVPEKKEGGTCHWICCHRWPLSAKDWTTTTVPENKSTSNLKWVG